MEPIDLTRAVEPIDLTRAVEPIDLTGARMKVRSIGDVAATIRGRRLDLGLTQEEVARRAGVSRRWIYQFEAGKPTAELGLVMRVVDALGLDLDLAAPDGTASVAGPVDLDALLDEHRGR